LQTCAQFSVHRRLRGERLHWFCVRRIELGCSWAGRAG
jgi:hypothetical protein